MDNLTMQMGGGISKPSALLLGDSISLSYRDFVKFLLQDKAEIFYPPENGRFVAYTFRALYEWSRDFHWSRDTKFVYWNNGLWDVVRIFGDEPQTPLQDYKILISRTYDRLKYLFPQATIIFATTTTVDESKFDKNIFYRSNADIEKYNKAAVQVILNKGGIVHDLYKITSEFPKEAWEDSTHFVLKARQILAAHIANLFENLLTSSRN